ncbi:MAG: hypothetical protein HYS13_02730 [Planctomycetia bacterium]|nr:hypothetical protein [Planctomycetia bacterium]
MPANAPYVAPPRVAPTSLGSPAQTTPGGAQPGAATDAPRPPRWAVPPEKATPDFPLPPPSKDFGRGREKGAAPAGPPPADEPPRWSVPPSQWKPRETIVEPPAPEDLPDEPPRYTFFSGVFHFPWRTDIFIRWLGSSLGLFAAGFLVCVTLPLLLSMQVFMIAGIPLVVPTTFAALWTLFYWSTTFITIVGDTGNGADRIREWPDLTWADRLAYAGFFLGVYSISTLPGYFLDRVIGFVIPTFGVLGTLLAFVAFPVFFASAATEGSWYRVLSPQVMAGLKQNWRGWLIFYALAAGLVVVMIVVSVLGSLAAVALGAVMLGGPISGEPTFGERMTIGAAVGAGFFSVFAPAATAASFIYARLLGRVMWQSNRVVAEMEARRTQAFPL